MDNKRNEEEKDDEVVEKSNITKKSPIKKTVTMMYFWNMTRKSNEGNNEIKDEI